jgi:hypothetical protein
MEKIPLVPSEYLRREPQTQETKKAERCCSALETQKAARGLAITHILGCGFLVFRLVR